MSFKHLDTKEIGQSGGLCILIILKYIKNIWTSCLTKKSLLKD